MPAIIELTHGFYASVDEADLDMLSQYKWHVLTRQNGTQYAATNVKVDGRYHGVRMHRMILNPPPDVVVDHRDGNGLNNVRANLRECSQSENMRNRRAYGRSKYLGVAYDASSGKLKPWTATIGHRRIGRYRTEIEAAAAYDVAALAEYGEFARPNFPGGPPPFEPEPALPTASCPVCGVAFQVGRQTNPRRHCSNRCWRAERNHHPDHMQAARKVMD